MDGSHIRNKKVVDSKVSGYVCAGPEFLIFLLNHSKSVITREGQAAKPRKNEGGTARAKEKSFFLSTTISLPFYHCIILVFCSPHVAQRK